MVLVNELSTRYCCSFLIAAEVNVDLRAWAAWTCIAHFPEIVLLVSEQDAVFGKIFLPCFKRLGVECGAVCLRSLEHCRIKSVLVKLVHFCEKLPSPLDGFSLEVVSETPVSEHFEHRVVIGVSSHLFKVVVLSAHTKTFLAVRDSFPLCRTVAEEPVLELIHAGIGKHKRRVVLHNHRCRWHNLMPL